jgi:uncharacterized protein YbjT (DUF2867 family)
MHKPKNIGTRQRVLVAGATGYLGTFVLKELKRQGYWVRALGRNHRKIELVRDYVDEVVLGEATNPKSIKGICKGIDTVFSSLGITKQKDGLTYMDVDYQGNRNILNDALAENVSKFIYISVFNSDKLRHLEIVKAKEKFVDELKQADIRHMIARPNGFFSDMTEFFKMAQRGRIYLFGQGDYRGNPIHGADLAHVCVERLETSDGEFDIGGPEILTQNEVAAQAFDVLGKKPKITYLPLWVKSLVVNLARTFTSVKTYGPIEFFLTVLTMDMVAPTYGQHTLKEYFKEISQNRDTSHF